MSDYGSLPDDTLVKLCEQAGAASDMPASAPLEAELSRRATALCELLDADPSRVCWLSNWTIRRSHFERHSGAVILIGQAFGHPKFPNGTAIATSPLEMILRTADGDLAVTQNSIYQLGSVHPELIDALLPPE